MRASLTDRVHEGVKWREIKFGFIVARTKQKRTGQKRKQGNGREKRKKRKRREGNRRG